MYLENYNAIYIGVPGINTSTILECFGSPAHDAHSRNLLPHAIINIHGYDIWSSSYKFIFVKNPWARMLSIYHNKKRQVSKFPTFSVWLKKNINKHRILPQLAFYTDTNYNSCVDFIGKVENFENDIKTIYKNINRPNIAILNNPDKITTQLNNLSYKMYYSRDNANLVKRYFAREIEMLEYKF
jgi:hypothetical protein